MDQGTWIMGRSARENPSEDGLLAMHDNYDITFGRLYKFIANQFTFVVLWHYALIYVCTDIMLIIIGFLVILYMLGYLTNNNKGSLQKNYTPHV